jgi:hypothetical protein
MTTHNVNSAGAPVAACDSEEMTACEVCLAEVPVSVAEGFEGPDYVHHFCGLNCLEMWRAKLKDKQP